MSIVDKGSGTGARIRQEFVRRDVNSPHGGIACGPITDFSLRAGHERLASVRPEWVIFSHHGFLAILQLSSR
jgi:hypothetical protein